MVPSTRTVARAIPVPVESAMRPYSVPDWASRIVGTEKNRAVRTSGRRRTVTPGVDVDRRRNWVEGSIPVADDFATSDRGRGPILEPAFPQRGLRGRKSRDGDAEGRARDVRHPRIVAERDA